MSNKRVNRGGPSPNRFGPESFMQGYITLVLMGVMVYGFSIANIYFVYLNDFFRLLGQGVLVSYFIVGAVVVYISFRFFNSMIMSVSIGWFVVLWTVFSASLSALQAAVEYPAVQIVHTVIIITLLYCLWMMARKQVSISVKKRIFYSNVTIWTSVLVFLLVAFWIAGYRRTGVVDGGEGLYHRIFGEGLMSAFVSSYFAIYMSIPIIGLFMWTLLKADTKWNFKDVSVGTPVSGHLFYQQGKWGYEGRWGYLAKGSNNFPDAVTFLYEKDGCYYFKRKPIGGSEEKIVLSKGKSTERGIFCCKVVGSEHPSDQVMVLYEEESQQWLSYEFEEIKGKAE